MSERRQKLQNRQQSMLHRAASSARNHHASIDKSLEHCLQVARAKGDENLIRQLEAEQNYYN